MEGQTVFLISKQRGAARTNVSRRGWDTAAPTVGAGRVKLRMEKPWRKQPTIPTREKLPGPSTPGQSNTLTPTDHT